MQARQFELVIRRVGHPERRLVLVPGSVMLGRADDNDIVLSEIGVSRRHARIVVDEQGVLVEDNGSGNGLFFRGKRVTHQQVGDGDEIMIDPFTLGFHVHGGDTTAEVPGGHDATVVMGGSAPVTGRLELTSVHRMARTDFPIPTGAVLTLGRSERADIVLPEPAASRLHADLGETGGAYWIRDRSSSNGTWVNGRRVREQVLESGDRVRIGAVEFKFIGNGAPPIDEPGDRTEAFDGVMCAELEGSGALERNGAPPSPDASSPAAPRPCPPTGPLAVPAALLRTSPAAPPTLPPAARPLTGGRPTPTTLRTPSGATGPMPIPMSLRQAPGVELDFDVANVKAKKGPRGRRSSSPGTGFFSRRINQLSVGILGLAGLLIAGRMTLQLASAMFAPRGDPAATPVIATAGPGNASTAAIDGAGAALPLPPTAGAAVARAPLTPAEGTAVASLMADGMRLFTEGKQFEAAAQFYKVQQLDPGHPDAKRMGYVACEFIAIQRLYDGLAARSASGAQRSAARQAALDAVGAAQTPAAFADARVLVAAALALEPTDPALAAALASLEQRVGSVSRAVVARRENQRIASLEEMVARGRKEMEQGNLAKAVTQWEAVLAADPTRASPQFYQAEEGIRGAKDQMKADSKKAYAAGMSAYKAGDLLTARVQLEQTARIDPYNDAAAARLAETRKRLKEQASDIYKEARVLEDINQTEKALALYQKVLNYVDHPGDPLASKAQARMNALMQ